MNVCADLSPPKSMSQHKPRLGLTPQTCPIHAVSTIVPLVLAVRCLGTQGQEAMPRGVCLVPRKPKEPPRFGACSRANQPTARPTLQIRQARNQCREFAEPQADPRPTLGATALFQSTLVKPRMGDSPEICGQPAKLSTSGLTTASRRCVGQPPRPTEPSGDGDLRQPSRVGSAQDLGLMSIVV